jgi:general stress protein YciG
MKSNHDKIIREFLMKAGRKGGKARAAKYDKATLSRWAKKGGRPPKAKKESGQ